MADAVTQDLGEYDPTANTSQLPSLQQRATNAVTEDLGEYNGSYVPGGPQPVTPEEGKKFHEGVYRHAFQSIPIAGALSNENLDDIEWQSKYPMTSDLTGMGVAGASMIPATEATIGKMGGSLGKEVLANLGLSGGVNTADTIAHRGKDTSAFDIMKALLSSAPAALGPVIARGMGYSGKWSPTEAEPPPEVPSFEPQDYAKSPNPHERQPELNLEPEESSPYSPSAHDLLKSIMPNLESSFYKSSTDPMMEGVDTAMQKAADNAFAQRQAAEKAASSKASDTLSGHISDKAWHLATGGLGAVGGGILGHMTGLPGLEEVLGGAGALGGYRSDILKNLLGKPANAISSKIVNSKMFEDAKHRALMYALGNITTEQMNSAVDRISNRDTR